jgi:N-acetylneuraminic acid mutarotase
MIVWGGYNSVPVAVYYNDGGRYDPALDTWAATSTAGSVPSARDRASAVWTGSKMIIWGGSGAGGIVATGGLYDPDANSWSTTSTGANVPTARIGQTAVWTGSKMIVWGGYIGSYPGTFDDGGIYNPTTDTWAALAAGGSSPAARHLHSAVWTGSKMIIWGGVNDSVNEINTGAVYDPSTGLWSATSTAGAAPSVREGQSAVWTGSKMIIWGGRLSLGMGAYTYYQDGAMYDPVGNSWTATSTADPDLPSARNNHAAFWTGADMIIWGGMVTSSLETNTGGRYTP